MKEYKLSAISKYSVCYLLCGLFMFFFMFAIFSLTSSADGILTPINYNFNSLNFDGVSAPAFTYTISGTGHFTYVGAGGSSYSAQQSFYVVTDSGSINIANYTRTFYGTSRQDITFSYSGTSLGKPINAYVESNDLSGGYGVFVWDTINLSLTVVDWFDYISGSSSSSAVISDYSSYSPLSVSVPIDFIDSYSSSVLPLGSDLLCSFSDVNSSNLKFTDQWIPFGYRNTSQLMFFLYYDCPTYNSAAILNTFNFSFYNSGTGVTTSYNINDFVAYQLYRNGNNGLSALYGITINLPDTDQYTMCSVHLDAVSTNGGLADNISFVGYAYKMTINDYMSYIKDNYNNITPSVSDLNQNTAQSVSDISTAQTFETTAFTNFDTQLSSSGLDTFSLSVASQPLLWCAGLINTFYNNMPSVFQYLLMFVAFMGVLVIVFNISGRVVRRFSGGD